MKMLTRLLRFIDPPRERERMQFRRAAAEAQANAHDLTRTMAVDAEVIRGSIERCAKERAK